MNRKRLVGLAVAGIVVLILIGIFGSRPQVQNAANTAHGSADTSSSWQVTTERDPMTDTQNIDGSVAADNQVQAWLDTPRPVLHVRCYRGKINVYVWTGTAASVETDYDGGVSYGHKVRLRFDTNPEFIEEWAESDDHKALFESDDTFDGTNPAHNLIVQMVQAKTLLFEFTPFNADPVIAHFNLQGLSAHIDEITKPCDWSVE